MIIDKISVLFFKVKLISYLFGELKISVLLLLPKSPYRTKILVSFEE